MSLRARLTSWLRGTLHRADSEREMHDEMRLHVELYEADLRRAGLPEDEARRRARRRSGSRRARTMPSAGLASQAWRGSSGTRALLRRFSSPSSPIVLWLGWIGANTADFSLVDTVLLNRTGQGARATACRRLRREVGRAERTDISVYESSAITTAFLRAGSIQRRGPLDVTIDGVPSDSRAVRVRSYLHVLASVLYGRVSRRRITCRRSGGPETPPAGGQRYAVGKRFGGARRSWAGDPGWTDIGHDVGVTPRRVRLHGRLTGGISRSHGVSGEPIVVGSKVPWFSVVGRLKTARRSRRPRRPGRHMSRRIRSEIGVKEMRGNTFDRIVFVPAGKAAMIETQLATPLSIVMTIVGLVLFIGCADVGEPVLARASARRGEISPWPGHRREPGPAW